MAGKDIILENRYLERPVTVCDLYHSLTTAIDTLDALADKAADQKRNKHERVAKCEGPSCPEPEQEPHKCAPSPVTLVQALGVISAWLRDCAEMVGRLPAGIEIEPPRKRK